MNGSESLVKCNAKYGGRSFLALQFKTRNLSRMSMSDMAAAGQRSPDLAAARPVPGVHAAARRAVELLGEAG